MHVYIDIIDNIDIQKDRTLIVHMDIDVDSRRRCRRMEMLILK